MAKPTDNIEFGTDVGAAVAEPSSGQKTAGWIPGDRPPAQWFTWFFRAYWRWINWFDTVLDTDDHATLQVTGDSSSTRAAIKGIGGNGQDGVQGQGNGAGDGVQGTGGATSGAIGVRGIGGSTNGVGVKGEGVGTGVGVAAAKGGSGTDAMSSDGNIDMSAAAYPSMSTGFNDRITPYGWPKAMAFVTLDGAGGFTLSDGFNMTSIAYADSGANLLFTIATDMADTNYRVWPVVENMPLNGSAPSTKGGWKISIHTKAVGSFKLQIIGNDDDANVADLDQSLWSGLRIGILVFGKQ